MNNIEHRLYVMVGYPGCGKTTFAKTLMYQLNAPLHLSSDKIREELFGFRDQTHNDEVFAEMDKRAKAWAKMGDCIYDATNLTKKGRRKLVEKFKDYYELHCIVVARPIAELIRTNNIRDIVERISDSIYKQILGKFELPTMDEGWYDIDYKFNTAKYRLDTATFDLGKAEDRDHDNPHHNETIKEHILNCFEHFHDTDSEGLLAMDHDLGKFFVGEFNEKKGFTQYIGHANLSSYIHLTETMISILSDEDVSSWDCNLQLILNHADIERMYPDFYFNHFAILYHDIFYAVEGDKERAKKSLSKPTKSIINIIPDRIDELVDLLERFNVVDSMRD